MGKIKSKQVKRAINEILEAGIELTDNFESNKIILGSEMPSKKMRNKMAGYVTRNLKQKAKEAALLEKKTK